MSTPVQYKRKFFDFFPTLKFLEMPSVGIDISDQAVRFVEIVSSESGHKRFRLKSFGQKKIADGAITGGSINKPEEITKVLAEIRKEHGFKFACVSLPEEKGYLFRTEVPNIEEKYIAENIEMRLEENVPIDATKAVFDYNLIRSDDAHRNLDAIVSVVPNKVIDAYTDLFQSVSILPVSYELVTQAVARAIVPLGEIETCLIIYVGDVRTGFGIVSEGALQFTSTVNVGHLADAVAATDKRSLLKDEILRLTLFWQNRNETDSKLIKRIIISGKDAMVSGLKEYLANAAGCRVDLANVWVNVFNFDNQIPEMTFEESLDYAPAVGLALSRFNHA